MSLRSKIIRLAHAKPDLRADLLHLVTAKVMHNLQTRPSPSEAKEILSTPWPAWDWKPLPEKTWNYFKRVPGTIVVPVRKLTPIRAREKGIANANKYMWMSFWGRNSPRKPLDLRDNRDGTYTVLDGNSTFANAKRSGWKVIPGVVVETA